MIAPVRIGTLGCGRIVKKALLDVVGQVPEAQLIAIASERPGVAKDVAGKHGDARPYDNYQALLNDPDVDAVYVPCTGDLHHQWAIAAAKARKHVLCEKPLATSSQQAKEMAAACRDHGVILQEAFMWRLTNRVKRTRELLASGDLGELRLINATFSFNIDRQDWRMRPEKGGGAMWDIGSYGVDAARLFTGEEPLRMDADARWAETGIDMSMRMGLTFPSGVLANIDCSFEVPWRCRLELVGTQGRIILDNAFQSREDAVIQVQRGVTGKEPIDKMPVQDENHHKLQLEHFCRSVRQGHLLAPAEDGVANMHVLDQALNIARGRCEAEL